MGTLFERLATLLLHEHTIAVGIKAISFRDGMMIRLKYVFLSSQSANKHKKRRFRQMKIRQEGLHNSEVVSRIDEKIRFAAACSDLS